MTIGERILIAAAQGRSKPNFGAAAHAVPKGPRLARILTGAFSWSQRLRYRYWLNDMRHRTRRPAVATVPHRHRANQRRIKRLRGFQDTPRALWWLFAVTAIALLVSAWRLIHG